MGDQCQSFETVREKVAGIVRWWDNCGEYMQQHSTPLGQAVKRIMAAQETEKPFPEGMDTNWALDVQSAQTVDFLSCLKTQNGAPESTVAWDLGTLTGVSAAVLSEHFGHVKTVEREASLANFARQHLDGSKVEVVQSEIDAFLNDQTAAGAQAD